MPSKLEEPAIPRPRVRKPTPRTLGALALAVGVATTVVGGLVLMRVRADAAATDPRATLPQLGEIPAFSMLDQRGLPITSQALRGQVLIVDFFYASCPTSCPRLSAQMKTFHDRLLAQGPGLPVHLVSITLDPENDTSDVLREYADRYHADSGRWSFLSGRSEELDRLVVKGFKMAFSRADPSAGLGAIMHGEWFVLVDRRGRIRGYYQISDDARMTELYRDAARLATEGDA